MSELTLLNLNSSEELVEELNLQESKLILGGQETGGSGTGGSSDDDECRVLYDKDEPENEGKKCSEVGY